MAKNEALLMFSGGLDSCAAATVMLERFDRLHLMTYSYGYGQVFLNWSKKGVQSLTDVYGQHRLVHVIGSVKDVFQRLLIRSIAADLRTYRSKFVWCLACKLAMHTGNIIYCLKNDLPAASDGSSSETDYYVEQMSRSLSAIRGFYSEYGIEFVTPVYDIGSREAKMRLLAEKGIRSMGISVRDRNPGTQPLCIPGNLIYFASTFFKKHPHYDEHSVEDFIERKAEIARKLIAEAIKQG